MSRASKEFPFRRRTSPPAETSYLIRIAFPDKTFQPDVSGLVFSSITWAPKKDRAFRPEPRRPSMGCGSERPGKRNQMTCVPSETGPEVGSSSMTAAVVALETAAGGVNDGTC